MLDFPESFVKFKAQGVSDHCLGLLWSHKGVMVKKPRPFKFFNCWTGHEQFLSTVVNSWLGYCDGNPMQCLLRKLKRLKSCFKDFNKEFFSDISGRVKSKRSDLEQLQLFNLSHVGQRRMNDERILKAELVDLEIAESEFYRHWLKEGDLNTRFFHQKVESNKKNNTIRVIMSEEGQCYESFDEMVAELVRFFTYLVGSADPMVSGCSVESLKDLLPYSLPNDAAVSLTKEVDGLEIKKVLFKQGKDKSLGPDGYTSGFFKAVWDIVRADFISTVRYFFQSSIMLPAFNTTALVLVPKTPNPCLARDFRPISCCSVVYKTITRILVDRLMPFFPAMISQSQSAYVRGRNIVDNTLLAQEIVKGYSRKSLSPMCAIKIDLQKAFDSVNWGFLFSVLEALGLPPIFCNWVKGCITTLMFSVSLNRSLVGFFKDSVLGVLSTLEKFYELSGLKLNAQKIEFFACGLSSHVLDQICTASGFRLGHLPVRYLGVPLVTRKLTGKDCAALLARLKHKLNQWSNRNLSFGGRLQLIKTGSDTPTRGARVGWNQVCSLKSEGGLGLKNLVVWSRACCPLLVRNILAGEGSLWIAWIKEYCFKSLSFWEVECKSHFSWILTKLLKLRGEARGLFFPYANWSLINGKWIWDNIRGSRDKVSWHRLIWFPGHIPKFSLISWMVILDRLPTKDRLARFGLLVDNVCGLCGAGMESRDHLFADCSFARGVWGAVLNAHGLSFMARAWDEQLHWLLSNLRGKTLRVRALKLLWTGFLYLIWEERNHRYHRNLIRSIDVIVNRILEEVNIKLYRHGYIDLRL
ncbi:uncharacterized protein LOC120217317 [Hibiscus syriacus]|uniref:uncharacterized protein LOC120217317 n=1 Tax=Hibiscus syriacus TaxID=106335 RepID=UPI001924120F|nr:uncharacterized protein LOC120217317 [Hibiscus syriacus]